MNIVQSESDTSINKIYDVVIVGTGPVGLAIAVGLHKRGINNILVVDQTTAFRQVGQVVDLLPNGLKALKCVDPNAYEAVLKASLTFANRDTSQAKPSGASPEWVVRDFLGRKIRSMALGFDVWLQKYGEGRVSISWYNLQTALRDLLPEDIVKPNHRCINVVDERGLGYVRLDCVSNASVANPYAHWANDTKSSNDQSEQSVTKSLRAKLIVAADGINSTVRRILYPDQDFGLPEYSGYAAVYCIDISDVPNEVRSPLEEKFFVGSPIVTVSNYENENTSNRKRALSDNARIILINRSNMSYLLHLPAQSNSVQGKSGSDLLGWTLQELEKNGFPNELKKLVALSPLESIQQRLYYIHRATMSENAWSAGRIVLAGDAAHGMPPFMAQGANQGLEDAMVLTTLITDIALKNDWDDSQAIALAFEKYEHLRRPFMEYIQESTLTLFPHSSNQAWEEYSQKVHGRNIDEMNLVSV